MTWQDQTRTLEALDAANPHTHKDVSGEWVYRYKARNVVTLTIERYAREHNMLNVD